MYHGKRNDKPSDSKGIYKGLLLVEKDANPNDRCRNCHGFRFFCFEASNSPEDHHSPTEANIVATITPISCPIYLAIGINA
jgi:hypothetical protein